jgi:pilus assembly protein CpaB
MNRNVRTLIVVGVALVAAAGATLGVYRIILGIPVKHIEVASTYAVVASRALPLGTRLTKDDVKLVAWPARAPIPGSFPAIEQVVDRGLVVPVSQNDPITESKVAPREAGAGLPPTIPVGMRAISVKVDEVIGVAGFVVPGTRVDVISILRRNNESISRVAVSNVQVLTAGTKYDQEMAKQGQAVPSSVVTLLVSSQDAERIGLAATEGRILLTLRNPLDVGPSASDGVRLGNLLGESGPRTPSVTREVKPRVVRATEAAPAPPPLPPPYVVEAIRAAKRTEETVKK